MEKTKFVQDLKKQLETYMYQDFSNIVILCIGSNKMIGDCIGPMVGEKLQSILKKEKNVIIYGDMKETLNFKNAKKVIENIFEKYKNPFIITVDSALGTKETIENIIVSTGWIKIGNSLGRSICYYSHINIKGVVGENKVTKKENIKILTTVNPTLVIKLSQIITNNLNQIIKEIEITNKT